jgi:hypothetical protein
MNKSDLEKCLETPRRLGTEQNIITQNQLEKALIDKNVNTSTQPFFYEPVFNFNVLIEILFLFIYGWGLLNIFLIQVFKAEYLWSYLFWILASILIYLFRTSFYHDFGSIVIKRALRVPTDDIEKQKFSELGLKSASNIYCVKESIEKPNKMIILGANFDSASYTMNKIVEKLSKFEIFLVPVMGLLSIGYVFLIENGYNPIFILGIEIIVVILLLFLFLTTILNFFDFKQNRSPGAVNNGSSVIALLRLIDIIKGLNLKNTIVIAAFFNGKEDQMIGSTAFCEFELPKLIAKYKIKKRNVSTIILESIGAIKKQLYLRERFSLWIPFYYHQNLRFYLKNFGIFYDYILKERLFSNRNSDHIPFLLKNYQAVTIFREYPESNTQRDTSDKISEENIEAIIHYLKKFIEAKDQDLKFEVY